MEGDAEGQLYDLVRAGEVIGQTCITDGDDDEPTITPALVEREFRRLAWPESVLTVQPRGGRVLVNFPTNVFTTNTAPSRREVTLLGRRVTIEAQPATYRWRFGDGTVRATSSPGSPYPGLDVTHEYRDLGPARARVDTEYAGRYRVAGGPWIQIVGTAIITGPAVDLTVIEARPKLTGRYAPGA
ncbi:hypothetical protein [Nocardioides sp. R-C-SC26]|uniref:hypothetical protein n=1 Tax=Nocardioides sp. R-C-SC26 TaxID=2870414 RepID=UPI001E2B4E0C|nr:hypothetical protein [Nocardioides sp. R-C-SC26]